MAPVSSSPRLIEVVSAEPDLFLQPNVWFGPAFEKSLNQLQVRQRLLKLRGGLRVARVRCVPNIDGGVERRDARRLVGEVRIRSSIEQELREIVVPVHRGDEERARLGALAQLVDSGIGCEKRFDGLGVAATCSEEQRRQATLDADKLAIAPSRPAGQSTRGLLALAWLHPAEHPGEKVALLHGPEQIADLPVPVAESPGAVRIGHPERSHLVEYLAPNSVFNSLPRQRSSPHLRPDDRLVTIDRVLHHASLGVA